MASTTVAASVPCAVGNTTTPRLSPTIFAIAL
jgi:hypothetical protein